VIWKVLPRINADSRGLEKKQNFHRGDAEARRTAGRSLRGRSGDLVIARDRMSFIGLDHIILNMRSFRAPLGRAPTQKFAIVIFSAANPIGIKLCGS
jgi:hypothetical protein